MNVEQLMIELRLQIERDPKVKQMKVTYGDNLSPIDDLFFEKDEDDNIVLVLDW